MLLFANLNIDFRYIFAIATILIFSQFNHNIIVFLKHLPAEVSLLTWVATSHKFFFLICVLIFIAGTYSANYYGKLIGKLSEFHHGVSGEVYAVDGRTLYIKDFTYDGEGPGKGFCGGGKLSLLLKRAKAGKID